MITSRAALFVRARHFRRQIKTISSRPELQQKMNSVINKIKSLFSPDLHDALKIEFNTFLNKLF